MRSTTFHKVNSFIEDPPADSHETDADAVDEALPAPRRVSFYLHSYLGPSFTIRRTKSASTQQQRRRPIDYSERSRSQGPDTSRIHITIDFKDLFCSGRSARLVPGTSITLQHSEIAIVPTPHSDPQRDLFVHNLAKTDTVLHHLRRILQRSRPYVNEARSPITPGTPQSSPNKLLADDIFAASSAQDD